MIVVTHPWFMSCSVSSSHMRTCMALPSRMKWKMSSMARLLWSPVVPCGPLSGPAPGVSQSLLGVGAPRCAAAQPCPAATSPKLDSLDCARLSPLSSAAHVTCVAAGASPASCTLLVTGTWSENMHNMSTGPRSAGDSQ